MVLPYTIDLEKSLGDALLSDTELLDHSTTRGIPRNDGNLNAMERDGFKGEAERDDNRFRYEAPTGQ